MAAAEAHVPDEAFEAVVEANVLMAGLAWEGGGLSYAHAVVRGVSKARGARDAPHGEQVAFSLLVQLAIERRHDAFIGDLIGFQRSVGLPVCLTDLGLVDPDPAEIVEIARATGQGPKGGRIIVNASTDEIAAAIRRVEALSARLQAAE
jgi:glycerol dehydrogenase